MREGGEREGESEGEEGESEREDGESEGEREREAGNPITTRGVKDCG